MNAHGQQSSTENTGRHEMQDVSIRLLVLSALGIVALILVSLAIVEGMDRWLTAGTGADTAAIAHATETGAPLATPALDPEQTIQRQRYEERQQRLLSTYAWVDRQQGIARIPIERAMELLAQHAQEAP